MNDPSRKTRLLVWLPLAVYGALAVVSIAGATSGLGLRLLGPLTPLASFTVLFYACYFALWKMKRPIPHLVLASVLPFSPLPFLVLLDVCGVELINIHHMSLPNEVLWLMPGSLISTPIEMAVIGLTPRDQDQVYVRGGIPQADGSLILYGATTIGSDEYQRETFKRLARLDAAGNVDTTFAPVIVPLEQVMRTFSEPDGSVLVQSKAPSTISLLITRMLPDGSLKEVARTKGYTDENPTLEFAPQDATAPMQLIPNWGQEHPKLIRLGTGSKPDEAFGRQAAKTIEEHDLGDFVLAALDKEGRAVVGCQWGLFRMDKDGKLVPPGIVRLEELETKKRYFERLTGLALSPDGFIYVTSGTEHDSWDLARLLRFDAQLQEDRSFSKTTSTLGDGSGEFHVLGFQRDGGVIVSLVRKMHGSRIFYLGRKGELVREVH